MKEGTKLSAIQAFRQTEQAVFSNNNVLCFLCCKLQDKLFLQIFKLWLKMFATPSKVVCHIICISEIFIIAPHVSSRRPVNPATRQPVEPATRQPVDPSTWRPSDPATRQPGDPSSSRPGDTISRRPLIRCLDRITYDNFVMRTWNYMFRSPVLPLNRTAPWPLSYRFSMARMMLALMLYFLIVAYKASCHTLSEAFLKSMKTS